MTETTEQPKVKPIDPLIERREILGLDSSAVLQQLGIGLLPAREGEDDKSVALRTAQELLKPTYKLLVKEVAGTDPEALEDMDDTKRLEHPQAFIDSTLALMDAYSVNTVNLGPEKVGLAPISLSAALSVSCLIEPGSHSKKTVDWAEKAVSLDPHANALLPKLQALGQAAPAK